MIYVVNSQDITFTIMDSVVIGSRTCRVINCKKSQFVIEDVDMRHFECYGVSDSSVVVIDSPAVVENTKIYFNSECENNKVEFGKLWLRSFDFSANKIKFDTIRSLPVPNILEGEQIMYYFDEMQYFHTKRSETRLRSADDILEDLKTLEITPFTLTAEELMAAYDKEREEVEEPIESVRTKVKELVKLMKGSKYTVCYTGAGISTSANIPDYRGPSGVWTLLSKGIHQIAPSFDKDEIRPTYTHYAITELARKNLINYVISTNGDGLHMRSGLPRHLICEQHGNAHKEVCEKCRKEYYRQFRPLENGDPFLHQTGRTCDFCGGNLRDTAVGFSEPIADDVMQESLFHARKSHLSIVLGASMNVQPGASFPDKCFKNNGQLVVVNLQKTPYDDVAAVRIFAKTDVFAKALMEELALSSFDTLTDAVLQWDPPTDPTLTVPKIVLQHRKTRLWHLVFLPLFFVYSLLIAKRR
eukprot:Phypoly_transcript_06606.p1 GENE.Phypoly_transcript_06606~~Phypoly_transcript_06606.p1  ORF type:complete len:471 (+),score=53.51 Phypoly_transcript_06606:323-1735(+)